MQVQDFVRVYQAKSDEELIQFALAPQQLTPDARIALQGELSRRAITIADNSAAPQHDGDGHGAGRSTTDEKLQKGDRQHEGVGDFVAEVLRTYHNHFWLFFKITAPAVVITTMAVIIARNELREISRHILRGGHLVSHQILEMGLINISVGIVTWMAFSFMYGATCIAMEESAAGFTPSAWRSFLNVGERLGPFLRLCFLLLVLALVTGAASVLLERGVFWVLRQWRIQVTGSLILVVSYVLTGLALLVVSRFSLAVPAVILDDYSAGQALFRSDKLTQGKWLRLAVLLVKSLIGGYIAAMCPFWLASFVPASVALPLWFHWILTAASTIGVAVVEPTLFIGFALLYLKVSGATSTPSKVLTSQLS